MPKGVYERKTNEERFWLYVEKCDDGCWRWTGGGDKNGYGQFNINRKPVRAHRYSYEHHHPLTTPMSGIDLYILHSCNNPACVNPAHLRLGTHQENMNDMTQYGRGVALKGEKNGYAKLNENQVLEIRNRYDAGGITQQKLADEYGVSVSLIGRIINRNRWSHI